MSLTHAERLRRRAAEIKGGDLLLTESADALDRMQRVLDELRNEPAITFAEHVEQSSWMKAALAKLYGISKSPPRQAVGGHPTCPKCRDKPHKRQPCFGGPGCIKLEGAT